MKTLLVVLQVFFCSSFVMAQPAISFWPHHVGDVWQYRSLFTGQLQGTWHIDSLRVDSLSRDTFIYYRGGDRYRIDTSHNLYNLNVQSAYPRYKLYADSGDSWFGGYNSSDSSSYFQISVSRIYESQVFGIPTTVKVFRFDMIWFNGFDTITFWIGNSHLASGFGVVRSDIEPSDVYVLTGAIIDSVQYGVIVSMKEEIPYPQAFDVLENYPNPFNNATVISYTISTDSHVNITIYDVLGRVVRTLVDEGKQRGGYNVYFRADDLASGTYFAVLKTDTNTLTHKLLFLK